MENHDQSGADGGTGRERPADGTEIMSSLPRRRPQRRTSRRRSAAGQRDEGPLRHASPAPVRGGAPAMPVSGEPPSGQAPAEVARELTRLGFALSLAAVSIPLRIGAEMAHRAAETAGRSRGGGPR